MQARQVVQSVFEHVAVADVATWPLIVAPAFALLEAAPLSLLLVAPLPIVMPNVPEPVAPDEVAESAEAMLPSELTVASAVDQVVDRRRRREASSVLSIAIRCERTIFFPKVS
jgi:hypothetical protein